MSDEEYAKEDNPVADSLRKRAYKEYQFINEAIGDKIQEELNSKKKQKSSNVKAAVVINERDRLMIPGLSSSVGFLIKSEGLKNLPDIKKSIQSLLIAMLGLNSILDLSLSVGTGQSMLFDAQQWDHLISMFTPPQLDQPKPTSPATVLELPKSKKSSKKKTALAVKDAVTSISSLARKDVKNAIRKTKRIFVSRLSAKDDFTMLTYLLMLTIFEYDKYLFDEHVAKSEQDYLVKVWAPIFEALFRGSGIRLKWGDNGFDIMSLKPDLLMIKDDMTQNHNIEHAMAAAEASKEGPSKTKYFFDHGKLLVEAKAFIDLGLSDGFYAPATVAQISGLEIFILKLVLARPGLYVATKSSYLRLPRLVAELDMVVDICNTLWTWKEDIVKRRDDFEAHLVNDRYNRNISAARYTSVNPPTSPSTPASSSTSSAAASASTSPISISPTSRSPSLVSPPAMTPTAEWCSPTWNPPQPTGTTIPLPPATLA
ncbi:hypothetical protein DM01DRAFT_1298632 [Hesseltinella vesiculosa]|uniref:Uncharacterized protein n=1 Tax=Hesseltinella vesiculosa TaxID=101127 RepID=A0A1X2GVN4_9FUNG|nr:hypothetical protein DM01DRAFT_1298632 [Hesseltinella vesiculosa]